MASHHRAFRAFLVVSAFVQAALLGTVGYLYGGATGPITGLPVCSPWVPSSVLPVRATVFRIAASPGLDLIPQFFLPSWIPLGWWLHEWTWLLLVAAVNVTLWTVTFSALDSVCRRVFTKARVLAES